MIVFKVDILYFQEKYDNKEMEKHNKNRLDEKMKDYLFKEPANTATLTCIHIFKSKQPILYVTHDKDDGMWQFLCGKTDHNQSDAMIVGLGEIVELFPEMNNIADMPMGSYCERKSIDEKWSFRKKK